MEGEPWIADDRKVVLPPRDELHTSMESLIHHFKIVTEGYRVPEARSTSRSSRRAASWLLRRLRRRSEAVAGEVRAPSFVALEATATCMHDALVADFIAIVGSLDTIMGEVDR